MLSRGALLMLISMAESVWSFLRVKNGEDAVPNNRLPCPVCTSIRVQCRALDFLNSCGHVHMHLVTYELAVKVVWTSRT